MANNFGLDDDMLGAFEGGAIEGTVDNITGYIEQNSTMVLGLVVLLVIVILVLVYMLYQQSDEGMTGSATLRLSNNQRWQDGGALDRRAGKMGKIASNAGMEYEPTRGCSVGACEEMSDDKLNSVTGVNPWSAYGPKGINMGEAGKSSVEGMRSRKYGKRERFTDDDLLKRAMNHY